MEWTDRVWVAWASQCDLEHVVLLGIASGRPINKIYAIVDFVVAAMLRG